MQHRTLDPRLSLAFDLYDPCELAADIGTDHAHLPAALLQRGRCQHMILTDISESALENARMEMIRQYGYDSSREIKKQQRQLYNAAGCCSR